MYLIIRIWNAKKIFLLSSLNRKIAKSPLKVLRLNVFLVYLVDFNKITNTIG